MDAMRWIGSLLLLAAVSGCPAPGATICDNGDLCPSGRACGADGACSLLVGGDDGGGSNIDGGNSDSGCNPEHFDCEVAGWYKMTSPTTVVLQDIWVQDEQHAFALADDGNIYKYDGQSWLTTPIATLPLGGNHALDLWGRSENELYVATSTSTLSKWDGSAWSTVDPGGPTLIYDVSGRDQVMVVAGQNGLPRYFDGTWHAIQVANVNMSLVITYGATVGYDGIARVVGNNAGYSDQSGTNVGFSGMPTLNAVGAVDSDNVFAVGAGGAVLHLTSPGPTWTPVAVDAGSTKTNTLKGLWLDGARGFAVGDRLVLRREPTTWVEEVDSDLVVSLLAVDASTTSVFAVGVGGTIVRRTLEH